MTPVSRFGTINKVRKIGRFSLTPCQSRCSAISLARFTRTILLRHLLVPFFNLESLYLRQAKIVGGYGDWQDEFGERRLNAKMEAPVSGAYQNNSDPFKSRFSHPLVQEIVPSERKVSIQDPQVQNLSRSVRTPVISRQISRTAAGISPQELDAGWTILVMADSSEVS